jgi:hypothetical protein
MYRGTRCGVHFKKKLAFPPKRREWFSVFRGELSRPYRSLVRLDVGEPVSLFRILASVDRGVYAFLSLLGYLAYLAFRPAFWAPYAAMLVTYHVFLLYSLSFSDREHPRSYSWPATITGHTGLLVLLVAVRMALVSSVSSFLLSQPNESVAQEARVGARFTALVIFLTVYCLARLERNLLFSGKKIRRPDQLSALEQWVVDLPPIQPGAPLMTASGADHQEWVRFRAQGKTLFYDPGRSPRDDFEQWLRARGKTQYPISNSGSKPKQK